MTAIIFALGSMFFAAINDFVYKIYGRSRESVGFYMAIVGVVSAVIFAFMISREGGSMHDMDAFKWGVISGIFSAIANILLVEVMSIRQVGICATIYRLNLAPAAILAFLFLGEPVNSYKVLGISAAVLSVLFFSGIKPGRLIEQIDAVLWIVVGAAILRAFMGISYKHGISIGAGSLQILMFNGIVRAFIGLGYGLLIERKPFCLSVHCVGYGVLSGVLISGIILFMMLALERGQASVVLPVAQLSFIITSIIGAIALNEKFTIRKTAGLITALICIIFMAVS